MMKPADIELIEQYIGGTLVESDVERLQTLLSENAEARAMLRSLATIDFGLHEIAAGESLRAAMSSEQNAALANSPHSPSLQPDSDHRVSSALSNMAKLLLALAAMVIIALATTLVIQRSNYESRLANQSLAQPELLGVATHHIAKINGMGGVILWTGDGGQVSSEIKVGTQLTGGTIEGASPSSWVELEFTDGSTVSVSGDSRLTFSDFGQKVLHLAAGKLTSNVYKQPANKPMLVHTRTATLEVIGTTFDVESRIDETSLNVTEGKVRLKRLSDGQSVDVPANQRVVSSSRTKLTPQQLPRSTSVFKSQLEFGPDHTFGKYSPKTTSKEAGLKLVPYKHTTSAGKTMMVFVAGMNVFRDGGSVVLQTDTRIRVRGHVDSPNKIKEPACFGVSVRQTEDSHRTSYISLCSNLELDENGNFDVIVDVDELKLEASVLEQNVPSPSPVGAVVESFFCSMRSNTAGLEISEVEFYRAGE